MLANLQQPSTAVAQPGITPGVGGTRAIWGDALRSQGMSWDVARRKWVNTGNPRGKGYRGEKPVNLNGSGIITETVETLGTAPPITPVLPSGLTGNGAGGDTGGIGTGNPVVTGGSDSGGSNPFPLVVGLIAIGGFIWWLMRHHKKAAAE